MMNNLTAFLTAIAISEGTEPFGNRGYDCCVGSRPGHAILFTDFSDHPRIKVQLSESLWSSAAGRYQVLAHYFDAYRESLKLKDFGPFSQDAIATQMIREQQAYEDVTAGRFESAVNKCAKIWASFAGSPYGQPTRSMEFLANAYKIAGGIMI